MDIESLQIKNKYYCDCDDITIYDFDFDIDLVKIFKRESKIDVNIYYIGYKPDIDDTITTLYFFVDRLFGFIEQIEGSNDRYLVVITNNKIIINIFNKLWKFIENEIISDDSNNKIKEYYKLRFDSDLYLPLDTLIEFHSLIINVSCVIEKDNEYYPEIYLEDVFTERSNIYKMNNTSDSNVKELKIDSTLWATPAKIINLLDFKPEKLSIKTESNDNIDIKIHQVRYENGDFYLTIDNIKGYFSFSDNINVLSMIFSNDDQKNKYHQVWKEIFKIVNDENGELKIHEKVGLFNSDMITDKIIKIP